MMVAPWIALIRYHFRTHERFDARCDLARLCRINIIHQIALWRLVRMSRLMAMLIDSA
jgi:hypothetical protein